MRVRFHSHGHPTTYGPKPQTLHRNPRSFHCTPFSVLAGQCLPCLDPAPGTHGSLDWWSRGLGFRVKGSHTRMLGGSSVFAYVWGLCASHDC